MVDEVGHQFFLNPCGPREATNGTCWNEEKEPIFTHGCQLLPSPYVIFFFFFLSIAFFFFPPSFFLSFLSLSFLSLFLSPLPSFFPISLSFPSFFPFSSFAALSPLPYLNFILFLLIFYSYFNKEFYNGFGFNDGISPS